MKRMLFAVTFAVAWSAFADLPDIRFKSFKLATREAKLTFAAPGEACALYAAVGDRDLGDDPMRWEDMILRLADVDAAATSAIVRIPEAWSLEHPCLRLFLGRDAQLPIDRQYAYVQGNPNANGTKGAYLRTGIFPDQNVETEVDFTPVDSRKTSLIYCSRTGDVDPKMRHTFFFGPSLRFDYGDNVAVENVPCSCEAGVRYFVRTWQRQCQVYRQGDLETPIYAYSGPASTLQFRAPEMIAFALAKPTPSSNMSDFGAFKLHRLAMRDGQGGKRLADFVPASKDGVVGFYNVVSNTFHASADADYPFVAGDEVEIEDKLEAIATSVHYPADLVWASVSGGRISLDFYPIGTDGAAFVALAAEDRGSDFLDWENAKIVRLGTVGPNDVSAQFAVPEGWGKKGFPTARVFIARRLPIDKRLTFVQGNRREDARAGAYLRTGIYPTHNTAIEAEFTLTDIEKASMIFCARKSTAYGFEKAKHRTLFVGPTVRYDYYDKTVYQKAWSGRQAGVRYLARSWQFEGLLSAADNPDVPIVDFSGTGTVVEYTTPVEMIVFALANPTSSKDTPAENMSDFSVFKLHRFIAREGPGGRKIADFIPASADGVAGFCDMVSGTFHPSADESYPFVAGEETSDEVGYCESALRYSAALNTASPGFMLLVQ